MRECLKQKADQPSPDFQTTAGLISNSPTPAGWNFQKKAPIAWHNDRPVFKPRGKSKFQIERLTIG